MKSKKHCDDGMHDGLELDVLIVGAGVSGLYTGWRLLTGAYQDGRSLATGQHQPRVQLIEASDRIGGRLETLFLPGMPHVRAEFGGMRYLSSHQIVANLVDVLGLPSTDFPMGGDNNVFYLRGKHYTAGTIAAASTQPDFAYKLAPHEQGKSPYDLFTWVITTVIQDGGLQLPSNAREWNEVKNSLMYKGKHIYDVGFWNLMLDFLSSEGFDYVADAGGYYSNVVNGGAGEGMEEIQGDFAASPTYLTLEHGYDQIPIALAERFRDSGGKIWCKNRLAKLERGQHGGVKATIEHWTKQKWTIHARHVVLGLPRRSLELLDPTSFIFESAQLNLDVASVIQEPAHKLFMGYEYPWWRYPPLFLRSGEAVTDLPLRQTYYFGTEAEQPGGEPGNMNSLLMAGYNDMWATTFWRGLELEDQQSHDLEGDAKRTRLRAPAPEAAKHQPYRMRPTEAAKRTPNLAAPGEGPGVNIYLASEEMVRYAQAQLCEIHGIDDIPMPYIAAFRDWSQDPYGAGYHAWATNIQVQQVMQRMRKPLPDANVYICGEAYSGNQGWVEGALTTTEKMLQEQFGLDWPLWLPTDYYLGW